MMKNSNSLTHFRAIEPLVNRDSGSQSGEILVPSGLTDASLSRFLKVHSELVLLGGGGTGWSRGGSDPGS